MIAIRLAANLSTMFQESPFDQRADSAAALGFSGLEAQFPYDTPIADWKRVVEASGLPLVLLNAPRGIGPGVASLVDRRAEFAASMERAAEYAVALSCPRVHVLAGCGGDRQCYLDNLALAVELLRPNGIGVVIEVLNQHDVPGYHLRSAADALAVMASVPGVGLQFDVYHSTRAGEDVAATLRSLPASPAHVQVSSCPGRHEPDDPIIDGMLNAIELGYTGMVGCEYWPRSNTLDGLGWAFRFGVGHR